MTEKDTTKFDSNRRRRQRGQCAGSSFSGDVFSGSDESSTTVDARRSFRDNARQRRCSRSEAVRQTIYNKQTQICRGGKLSMTFCGGNCWPLTDSKEDIAAADRCFQFTFGWFAHPVFKGDYPPVMREIIDRNSKSEGRNASRLPVFTQQEIEELKGSADFFGMNYYSAQMAQNGIAGPSPSHERDTETVQTFDPSWPATSASPWMRDIPQGLRMLANKVKDEYGNPIVLVTENGISDDGSQPVEDNNRIHYYEGHLAELRRAIYEDGCNVIGHISWSIMDNFEWRDGYTRRFGLVSVDYNSPKRTRTWKKSAHWFHHYLAMHKVLQ